MLACCRPFRESRSFALSFGLPYEQKGPHSLCPKLFNCLFARTALSKRIKKVEELRDKFAGGKSKLQVESGPHYGTSTAKLFQPSSQTPKVLQGAGIHVHETGGWVKPAQRCLQRESCQRHSEEVAWLFINPEGEVRVKYINESLMPAMRQEADVVQQIEELIALSAPHVFTK